MQPPVHPAKCTRNSAGELNEELPIAAKSRIRTVERELPSGNWKEATFYVGKELPSGK